ncbi:hypothetical protein [Thermus scotoductus]|nr:hypothetical protein [Thermus scotoductus]
MRWKGSPPASRTERCPTEERRGFCYLKPSLVRLNLEIRQALASLTLQDLLPEAKGEA